MFSVCRRPSVGSKCAPKTSVNSVRSVREKTPQRVTCVSSFRVGAFYFSQKNTDEQNTQRRTETLSQPISQNVTATFSWNVLWILYAGGLLWVQKVGGKVLLNLWVLWEKKTFTKYASSLIGVTSHITPLPMGEGQGGGATRFGDEPTRFGGEAAVISIREGTVLLFYHVTFLSPNNALHDTKKVTNLSHYRLFTYLTTCCKDK